LESPDGLEIGGSGLSATLRDYERFGLFLLAGGSAGGEQIPDAAATIHEGAFEARGIFGQHVYMNPRENVVIAVWSALPKPTGKAVVRDYDFFAVVSEVLR
jgi:CubicO group peptidase (beta-lactamase class C family)